jgi:hypothetical protein
MQARIVADIFCRAALCLGISFAYAAAVQRTEPDPQPALVESADFGLYTPCGHFVRTDHVPLVPGQSFAWRVQLSDPNAVVTWTEEIILPAAPELWRSSDPFELRDGGRIAVTERAEIAVDGVLEHGWTITEGDPAGEYEVRIRVNGEPVESFTFDVQ